MGSGIETQSASSLDSLEGVPALAANFKLSSEFDASRQTTIVGTGIEFLRRVAPQSSTLNSTRTPCAMVSINALDRKPKLKRGRIGWTDGHTDDEEK